MWKLFLDWKRCDNGKDKYWNNFNFKVKILSKISGKKEEWNLPYRWVFWFCYLNYEAWFKWAFEFDLLSEIKVDSPLWNKSWWKCLLGLFKMSFEFSSTCNKRYYFCVQTIEYLDLDTNQTFYVNETRAVASSTALRRNPLYSQVKWLYQKKYWLYWILLFLKGHHDNYADCERNNTPDCLDCSQYQVKFFSQ